MRLRSGTIRKEIFMPLGRLVALPVFNEARHVDRVLDEVRRHTDAGILVVDDG